MALLTKLHTTSSHSSTSTVLVFRTNLNDAKDVAKIKPQLNTCTTIIEWSVDLEDIDKILRIESTQQNPDEICGMVRKAGYQCEELPD